MSDYIITIEKTYKTGKEGFTSFKLSAEDMIEAINEIDNHPEFWGDCVAWDIFSIVKQ